MTEQIRSFIAIELPDEIQRLLTQVQAQLKESQCTSVKWADPQGIHLTLKFLGNIDINRIDEITRIMAEAARGISPFRLAVKELGAFPNLKRVQVIWVGLGDEVDQLNRLQQCLESNLAPLGFPPELRPFRPHLTLARVHDHAPASERQYLGQLIANTSLPANLTFHVDAINLMKSQLTREGAIYNRISLVQLEKPLSSGGI